MTEYTDLVNTVIPKQSGTAFLLKRGQKLRVIDPEGQQVCDFFCFSYLDSRESFSASRSLDYADTLYLTSWHSLFSNRSHVMCTIIEDDCGRHDLLMPPCSLEMFQLISGTSEYHPSCMENLQKHLKEFGIEPDQIGTTFNIFMNVTTDADGEIKIDSPLSKPGSSSVLRAEMDLIVGLTACSHEESNAGTCKSIQYEIISS